MELNEIQRANSFLELFGLLLRTVSCSRLLLQNQYTHN